VAKPRGECGGNFEIFLAAALPPKNLYFGRAYIPPATQATISKERYLKVLKVFSEANRRKKHGIPGKKWTCGTTAFLNIAFISSGGKEISVVSYELSRSLP